MENRLPVYDDAGVGCRSAQSNSSMFIGTEKSSSSIVDGPIKLETKSKEANLPIGSEAECRRGPAGISLARLGNPWQSESDKRRFRLLVDE